MNELSIKNEQGYKAIYYWLWVGLVMLFFQVVIGGITRLTESGLSITKWEVISGTLPPMNAAEWEKAFNLYKDSPQYREINEGMSMHDFKFIYFWEYFHRLWARIMGFVFLIPFVYFIYKKALDSSLIKKLLVLVLLAALAASFGWIMVASGLIERPWVNAYKLSLHLMTALLVIAYLWWIIIDYKTKYFAVSNANAGFTNTGRLKKYMYVFIFILTVQIFLGGMMSGMKIAVLYPTWPDMYDQYIPDAITEASAWTYRNMVEYDSNSFFPALVHFLHRNWAYLLFLVGGWIVYKMIVWSDQKKIRDMRMPAYVLAAVIVIQIFLGIITVISSTGKVPVLLGVLHQAGALILYITALYIIFVLLASEKRRDITLTLKEG